MKVTKATLKKLARKNELEHITEWYFDGMIDGLSKSEDPEKTTTTLKDINDFFTVSRNWLSVEENGKCVLTNCCYRISFYHKDFQI